MKKSIILFIAIGLVIVGCGQSSTKREVYSGSWDGEPIIVKKNDATGNYETVNELTHNDKIEKLIKTLKNAPWKENVDLDSREADYRFEWNSFNHRVWVNDDVRTLTLSIDERSGYVNLSNKASQIVFEILIGEKLN